MGKAKLGRLIDAANVNYDLAVRKLAVSDGYKAFTAGNPEQALKYYAFEYMKKPSSNISTRPGTAHQKLFVHDGKKPCFSHNKEEGCSRDEKT